MRACACVCVCVCVSQVFDSAPVLRVDEGRGLLLSLPLGGELGGSCPAFCHASNVADERPERLSAVYKAGSSKLKCRVIGFRLLDGLATVSATTTALKQQVGLTHTHTHTHARA